MMWIILLLVNIIAIGAMIFLVACNKCINFLYKMAFNHFGFNNIKCSTDYYVSHGLGYHIG